METIRLATWIDAPVDRCFQLSLSTDLHLASAQLTRITAAEGATTGLIGQGETFTFTSRHLGLRRTQTNRIELLRPPSYFREVMVAGPFQHFEHDHHFAPMDDGTRMRDEIRFSAPWSLFGLTVRKRLVRMFSERNAFLKRVAESDGWHQYLDLDPDDRPGVTTTIAMKNRVIGSWDESNLLRGSQS
jgi:ligand-binding SRPBCC domain-containing protein